MKNRTSSELSPIIYLEIVGLLAILCLTWIDEGLLIPQHLLPTWLGRGDWHDAVVESILILVVGGLVIKRTLQLCGRITQLEKMLSLCAWCQRAKLGDRWVAIEEYLALMEDIQCSHGMCSECAQKFQLEGARLTQSV